MRRPLLFEFLVVLLVLLPALPSSAEEAAPHVTIGLLTIGPGDLRVERFGHTALVVMRTRPGQKKLDSLVYNFGAADFDDPAFLVDFLRGKVTFRAVTTGTLAETLSLYSSGDRTVTHQRLRLTADQVRRLESRLAWSIKPEHRDYPYHYLRSSCASKVRDVLDDALGGELRRQLDGQPDRPVRDHGREWAAGDLPTELLTDLFMGRRIDLPTSKYFSLYVPSLLRDYLQLVKVPDPEGRAGLVPLAEPPDTLYPRQGPLPQVGDGRGTIHLAYLMMILLLGLGIHAYRGGAAHPRRAGVWLLLWSLPLGIAALLMLLAALFSTVAEWRVNELMLVFPATDLALLAVALRWLRGRATAGRLLWGYAVARLALVALSLAGHAAGLLIQRPLALVFLSLVCAAGLVVLSRRLAAPAPYQLSRQ